MLSGRGWRPSLWVESAVLVAILVVAGLFRFTQLQTVPPGMTHDEAAFGAEAEMILGGERPLYFALGYGHEPAYAYLAALAFSLLGRTMVALRVASAVCGLLVVLGAYLVARQLFGVRVAWVSAAWLAVAFWPVSLSRQALRAITLPMLWLPAVWTFWVALQASSGSSPRPDKWARIRVYAMWALSGLLLGATVYTYMASRVAWAVYPLFALYLLLRRETRALLKRAWPGMVVMLLVAVLVALPLVFYLRAHPQAEVRVDVMMDPIRDLLRGRPQRVLRYTWNAVRVFSWEGDRFWAYNIPGRPVFGWVGSLLFYGGLAVAIWHWRDLRHAFLLIWLVVGMAPAMVTTNEGIFLRAVVAMPVVYILVAIAPEALLGLLTGSRFVTARERGARWAQVAWSVFVLCLLLSEGVRTYRAYFVEWPSRAEARNIYNHNLVATARYLRDAPVDGAVGISALYPLYYHDPWIVRYVAGRHDLALRWFDGRGGMVYPAEGDARYVVSALTPLDAALRGAFEEQATLVARRELAPEDQNPSFEVWHWDGGEALRAELDALQASSPAWISPEVQFTQPEVRRELQVPVQFGDAMALVGYRLNDASPLRPGDVVELVTYWRALRTVHREDDWVTFVHLLDADSREIGGTDVLHSPPTGWHPGDVVVQVHRFSVAEDAPLGQEAYLELGVYRRSTGRVPVIVDGQPAADRVLLSPIKVE